MVDSEATVSIAKLIGDVQKETSETVINIGNIADKVEISSGSVKETINTFGKIQQEIMDVSETAGKIAELVKSQSNDFIRINNEMEELTIELKEDKNAAEGCGDNVLLVADKIFKETNEIN